MKKLHYVFCMVALCSMILQGCSQPAGNSNNPRSFTVSFDAGNGSGIAPDDITVNEGETITLPGQGELTAPQNYIFNCWKTGGVNYYPDTDFIATKNVVFIAQWSPIVPSQTTYTVTYYANGASGSPPSSQTVNAGDTVAIAGQENLYYSGNTFSGWNTSPDGGGISYMAGESVTANSNISLYAQWTTVAVTTHTVTYYANGASGSPPSSQTVNAGDTVAIAGQGSLYYSGNTFSGWNTSPNGGGISYMAGESVTADSNISLYAQWTTVAVTTYTVTYYANGASGSPPSSQAFNAGDTVGIAGQGSLYYSGKNFTGWNTNPSGSGRSFAANSSFIINSNMSLFAQWETPSPTAPGNLSTHSPSSSYNSHEIGVFITWDAATGASYYNIYWDVSISGSFSTLIGTTALTSYNDRENLFAYSSNYYKVAAVYPLGEIGPKSIAVIYTFPTISEISLNAVNNGSADTTITDDLQYHYFTPIDGISFAVYWFDANLSYTYGDVSLYAYWADTGVEITVSDNDTGSKAGPSGNHLTIPKNNGGQDVVIKVAPYSSGRYRILIRAL
ncbi:MAG: InlB B-repeat-containing protein [Spirochaetaceae bacterium]|jgi:hypothetical protein|nr:InlB B-repeat-containing protein [Spirochaetaceae bacterium]